MTDQQLYLSIGIPSVVALIGILVNIGYFVALNGRITALDNRVTSLETRVSTIGEQLAATKALVDIILKKLDELEARRWNH